VDLRVRLEERKDRLAEASPEQEKAEERRRRVSAVSPLARMQGFANEGANRELCREATNLKGKTLAEAVGIKVEGRTTG
jgi:hypothetical protein